MNSYKGPTFEDHNPFSFEIANVNESAVHFGDGEKSNQKLLAPLNYIDILTSNPSNSTALGSQDDDNDKDKNIPHLEDWTRINWERGVSAVLMQVEDSKGIVDRGREDVCAAHVLSPTVSTGSPAETVEETPKTNDLEELNYNSNVNGMEVEAEIEVEVSPKPEKSKSKNKPEQSNYKNKPKEIFQKTVQIYNYFKSLSQEQYRKILTENWKSYEQWSEELKQLSLDDLTNALKEKQYCCFAGLYDLMSEVQEQGGKIVAKFDKKYKNKVSKSYFKINEFKSKDLFSWMMLVQIALVLIPEDSEYLELRSLKKSTVCLNTWLLDSPMKQKNKDLYRDSIHRNHLREFMTEIYNNLMDQAMTKMDQGRRSLLQRISDALGTKFANLQRNPRRVAKVVRSRTSPQCVDIDGGMTGKRGASRAPMLSEDVTTKKVNKQRK